MISATIKMPFYYVSILDIGEFLKGLVVVLPIQKLIKCPF
jgi:hypothetical protein